MSAVDSIGSATSQPDNGAKKTAALGQDTFLQLMMAQLKNQDPFKPVDPTAFLSQLAQFSSVTGIQEMRDSIGALATSLRSSQVLDGTSLVGRDVISVADQVTLGTDGAVSGTIDVPEGASAVTINIKDSAGQLIRKIPVDAKEGPAGFTWDGLTYDGTRADAGAYDIEAVADIGGANYSLETQVGSRVDSVTIDPQSRDLILNTTLGPIALADVRRVM